VTSSPGVRRRPSAQQRHDDLLRAGMELAGERGMAGVTHRAVAARAGVSLGSTSYFFSSLDELLVEAIRRFVAERSSELAALIDGAGDGAASPAGLAARFATTLMASDRTAALAEIEAYLHAARHRELRPVVREAFAAFEQVTEEALTAGGSPRAAAGARAFNALSDGFLLRHLADPQPDDEDALREALLSLAIAYAMPDAERERWRERLARPLA
jgi:TetR/AcrR family transcriptional regulator, regulator of biofilm formation and stress response